MKTRLFFFVHVSSFLLLFSLHAGSRVEVLKSSFLLLDDRDAEFNFLPPLVVFTTGLVFLSLSYVTNPIHLFIYQPLLHTISQLLGLLLHWTNQRNSHTKTLNIWTSTYYSSFLLPFTIQIFLLCLIEVNKSNFVEEKPHCTVCSTDLKDNVVLC